MKEIEIKHRSELWRLVEVETATPVVVELGVAEGRHVLDMLKWPFMPVVHAVDRWKHVNIGGDSAQSQEWHNSNYSEVLKIQEAYGKDRVIVHKGDSSEVAGSFFDQMVDLIYVDADHSYQGCKKDIKDWFYILRTGGIMAFHDYENPAYGVKRAIREFCRSRNFTVHRIPENKPEDAGAWFRKV